MPRLIVIKGADEGKQVELTGERLGAGRDSSNRIRLHDTEASRRHAEFHRVADGYRVTDVGSANGTFVNGQSIRDVLLQPGDQIQIGQTILVYSAGPRDGAAGTRASGELADRISLITRHDLELSSAIVQTIGETEGSRLLSRPDQVQGPWLKTALANLSIMYEASQAVSHILDLDQLLEQIMDLIFRSLDDDRGCIMLCRASREASPERGADAVLLADQLEPKVVRWREGGHRQEKLSLSRTIMEHVLRQKQGILVSDAARDERFQAVQSIVRFGIREVICVPMKGRHETLGVLYLDTRTHDRSDGSLSIGSSNVGKPACKFTGDHLALAIAIAHQAALAIEETRYYQAMVQAERLGAVGQTIAALSHDVKNILQGLRSGGDILKMGIADMDRALLEQGWKMIEKNQDKIYHLVRDMLTYSKEREPDLEDTDLNAVVRDVLELVAVRARDRGVAIDHRLDPALPVCSADPEALHRALLNLVGNALDAVEDTATPRVTVGTRREPPTGGEQAWVRIEVCDNGPGIAPEKLGEIFRPFVSSKGARGTGLGLAVSRKILREHGGDVLVESKPGQGSVFILRLPLRGAAADARRTSTELPTLPPPADTK